MLVGIDGAISCADMEEIEEGKWKIPSETDSEYKYFTIIDGVPLVSKNGKDFTIALVIEQNGHKLSFRRIKKEEQNNE